MLIAYCSLKNNLLKKSNSVKNLNIVKYYIYYTFNYYTIYKN